MNHKKLEEIKEEILSCNEIWQLTQIRDTCDKKGKILNERLAVLFG